MLVKDNYNTCTSIPPLKNENDSFVFSDNEKADLLNDYFISVSTIDDSNVV